MLTNVIESNKACLKLNEYQTFITNILSDYRSSTFGSRNIRNNLLDGTYPLNIKKIEKK